MAAMAALSIKAGKATTQYVRAPHDALRRAVLEKLYNGMFTGTECASAADLSEDDLLAIRCEAEYDGNMMPVPLADVWGAMEQHFDASATRPWMVTDAQIVLQRPGADEEVPVKAASGKRQRSDMLQKVRHRPLTKSGIGQRSLHVRHPGIRVLGKSPAEHQD